MINKHHRKVRYTEEKLKEEYIDTPKKLIEFWEGKQKRYQRRKINILFPNLMSPEIIWVEILESRNNYGPIFY